jgi:2-amino-4-ketopentanoate thiolase alpha subunit
MSIATPIPAGTRVEIRARVLDPADRAPGLPPDTAALPYEMRARGTLVEPCAVGEEARILTAARRTLVGTLTVVEPADTHTFGRPHPALVEVAGRIGGMLEEPA